LHIKCNKTQVFYGRQNFFHLNFEVRIVDDESLIDNFQDSALPVLSSTSASFMTDIKAPLLVTDR